MHVGAKLQIWVTASSCLGRTNMLVIYEKKFLLQNINIIFCFARIKVTCYIMMLMLISLEQMSYKEVVLWLLLM